MRYDYYTVDVPGDCGDSIFDLAFAAIRQAEKRARSQYVPAHWSAYPVSGKAGDETVRFRVRRKRAA
jgi:hypothetical protein